MFVACAMAGCTTVVVGAADTVIGGDDVLSSNTEFGEGVGASSILILAAAVGFNDQVD